MDTGAQGLHIPMVNSAADAERAVQSVKYHPRGTRGLASVRAADYAQAAPFQDYIQQANRETLVIVHIETAEAVENLREIVAVEGVDVVFIGPTDLSHSLGVAGQMDHPSLQHAMNRITETVGESEAALGILVGNAQAAQQWRERGARYIAVTFESLLTPAVKTYLSTVRAGHD